MFVRLTTARRGRAGWLLAFVYLLCVLAPTISFALPGSQAVAPCLIAANHAPGLVHVHTDVPTRHVHIDSQGHDHCRGPGHASGHDGHCPISMALNAKSVP